MSMFTFGWGLRTLWVAVQPLPEPDPQPGQSRGEGERASGDPSHWACLFVCFLMVKVELLRVIFLFFLEMLVCPLFPGDNQQRLPELTCTGSLTNAIVREFTAWKLANGAYQGFFP